jgi:hypothetical protein
MILMDMGREIRIEGSRNSVSGSGGFPQKTDAGHEHGIGIDSKVA